MTDHSARPVAPEDDAPATAEVEQVAPSKPVTPLTPRRPSPAPEPVDVEVDESVIVSPVASPSVDEVEPAPRGPFEGMPSEAPAASAAPLTSIQLLGRAAATNASLSASGAPTPLGGVPRVDGAGASPVDLGDSGPRWVPTFAATAPADEPPAQEPAVVPAAALDRHDLGADVPLYRPRVAPDAGAPPAPAGPADAEPPLPRTDGEEPPRTPGRAWPLVLIGLVTMAAIGLAIVWPALHPSAIEIPAQHVVGAPQGPAVEPTELVDPTPFLDAMPRTAGAWALTAATTNDPLTDATLPGRVAEWHTLTYSTGSDEATLEARQLYTPDDALDALEARAGADAVLADATVGDVVVGVRAETADGDQTRVMWTHDAAYFEAVGPTEAVLDLVEVLGL